ncbi:AAA family ATPase [Geothrix fermentans]|jgi:MoxR-like ATPase|uniref:AAA family ATPase n=1 Tax=Geothrix fermentans TaxID=44676 RepID=UPI0004075812|nr:MoxR family ATPase [Geothrix fermentans]
MAQTAHSLEPLLAECRKVIVGQPQLLNRLLVALLCRGHVLLEGLPGLAKTRTIKTLASASHTSFHRIQFTPDLLPSDVVGTLVFDPKQLTFTPKRGPIFANLVLADEINRAPSKVQAALLEAMEERQVTLGEDSFRLPDPFLVLATQNPLEQEGTFPLPEAQMDRFLFKLRVDYPRAEDEVEVLRRAHLNGDEVNPVVDGPTLLAAGREAQKVRLDDAIRTYIVKLVQATRPGHGKPWKGKELLRCGASPRASLSLQASTRALAYLQGRDHVLPQDVVDLAPDVLRHRLLLTFESEADGATTDQVIAQLLQAVPRP